MLYHEDVKSSWVVIPHAKNHTLGANPLLKQNFCDVFEQKNLDFSSVDSFDEQKLRAFEVFLPPMFLLTGLKHFSGASHVQGAKMRVSTKFLLGWQNYSAVRFVVETRTAKRPLIPTRPDQKTMKI